MAGTNGYTAQQFIDAIPGTGGVVSAIADKVGCTWNTAKKYLTEYATVYTAWQNERNRINDRARHHIIQAILAGDLQMCKWWLQVMDEEFKPKQEVDVTSGGERIEPAPSAETVAAALAILDAKRGCDGCQGCGDS